MKIQLQLLLTFLVFVVAGILFGLCLSANTFGLTEFTMLFSGVLLDAVGYFSIENIWGKYRK